jgi:hypothetical protein
MTLPPMARLAALGDLVFVMGGAAPQDPEQATSHGR